ncbi:tRNA (adenine-58-N(1)-) methyltransferase [Acidothermus cellulolyticus 11B]|uniref:tRNA (adenine(58)-N(1))-methyltransferase TrmI n=1 Tax=Acidothermus cellulolyticus (strain ATCC 43068 / DSM 8971 / 11B) TaxID=351607 RepID=A0LU44_ACIC1|nr:tRNA (adenine-N1)-methyltransferase [Acidothermus cellulolyticus]ABK52954.1 tRNA (adenine-58-N(1)-) methyltransferase [Acidothermus cellulolyticus 11B]
MTADALAPGDRVQLIDPKGRRHLIVLEPGRQFHTHQGIIEHDHLIGQPEGCVVQSTRGTAYLAFRPTLADFVLAMPRGAAVVYPKDAAMIIGYADVFPGAVVLEAGAGSGALTCWLLRAAGDRGKVISVERRPDFAMIARRNVTRFFGALPPTWRLVVGDLTEVTAAAPIRRVDRIVLDLLEPWACVPAVARLLVPGGLLCSYVATTTQLSRIVETLRSHGEFAEPVAFETLLRTWHVDGLAVRPDHRMIGHTGFLVLARRVADGVIPPPRRRRPAHGAHRLPESQPPGGEDG